MRHGELIATVRTYLAQTTPARFTIETVSEALPAIERLKIQRVLSQMATHGEIRRISHGFYALWDTSDQKPAPAPVPKPETPAPERPVAALKKALNSHELYEHVADLGKDGEALVRNSAGEWFKAKFTPLADL